MKSLKYILTGIIFGIVMYKSQAVSWFRIYEMFRFESFHMYGIIGSALALGVLFTQLIKKYKIKSFAGDEIKFAAKNKSVHGDKPLIDTAEIIVKGREEMDKKVIDGPKPYNTPEIPREDKRKTLITF